MYGSGVTLTQAFNYDKERIKKALDGQLLSGENESGFTYKPAKKEDCNRYILEAFDNAVFHCMDINATAIALEKYLDDKGFKINFSELVAYMELEKKKAYESKEYIYEPLDPEED